MKWNRSPLRRVVRPSRLAALAAVGGIALAGVAHERHSREAHREAERHAVLDRAAVIGAEIERLVGGDLRLARSYAAMLAVDPGMPPERMRALAGQMLQGASEIRALAVAPGGLVSMVEPIEGNAALLGRALGVGEGGLAGPFETPDGRRVLVARAPVRIVGGEAPGRIGGWSRWRSMRRRRSARSRTRCGGSRWRWSTRRPATRWWRGTRRCWRRSR